MQINVFVALRKILITDFHNNMKKSKKIAAYLFMSSIPCSFQSNTS